MRSAEDSYAPVVEFIFDHLPTGTARDRAYLRAISKHLDTLYISMLSGDAPIKDLSIRVDGLCSLSEGLSSCLSPANRESAERLHQKIIDVLRCLMDPETGIPQHHTDLQVRNRVALLRIVHDVGVEVAALAASSGKLKPTREQVGRLALHLTRLAVRILPAESRNDYAEEFEDELLLIGASNPRRWTRTAHGFRTLVTAVSLRRALIQAQRRPATPRR